MFLSKNPNRKERRKFNNEFAKLPKETQHEALQSELMEKISPAMNKAITEAMISGINLAFEQLYEDFVSHVDDAIRDCDKEKQIYFCENLLSAIRKRYVGIQAKKAKEEIGKVGEQD